MSCAFCGRENSAEFRFCLDSGTPVHPSATRVRPEYVPRPLRGLSHLRSALDAEPWSFASQGTRENRILRWERV